MTFCQWELAARMKGQVVYSEVDGLGCGNAQYCFSWKGIWMLVKLRDMQKYVKNLKTGRAFCDVKNAGYRLGCLVLPLLLLQAESSMVGYVCLLIMTICGRIHLAVDYMAAATDTHHCKQILP